MSSLFSGRSALTPWIEQRVLNKLSNVPFDCPSKLVQVVCILQNKNGTGRIHSNDPSNSSSSTNSSTGFGLRLSDGKYTIEAYGLVQEGTTVACASTLLDDTDQGRQTAGAAPTTIMPVIPPGTVVRIRNWNLATIVRREPLSNRGSSDNGTKTVCIIQGGTLDVVGGYGMSIVGNPVDVHQSIDVRRVLASLSASLALTRPTGGDLPRAHNNSRASMESGMLGSFSLPQAQPTHNNQGQQRKLGDVASLLEDQNAYEMVLEVAASKNHTTTLNAVQGFRVYDSAGIVAFVVTDIAQMQQLFTNVLDHYDKETRHNAPIQRQDDNDDDDGTMQQQVIEEDKLDDEESDSPSMNADNDNNNNKEVEMMDATASLPDSDDEGDETQAQDFSICRMLVSQSNDNNDDHDDGDDDATREGGTDNRPTSPLRDNEDDAVDVENHQGKSPAVNGDPTGEISAHVDPGADLDNDDEDEGDVDMEPLESAEDNLETQESASLAILASADGDAESTPQARGTLDFSLRKNPHPPSAISTLEKAQLRRAAAAAYFEKIRQKRRKTTDVVVGDSEYLYKRWVRMAREAVSSRASFQSVFYRLPIGGYAFRPCHSENRRDPGQRC